MGLAIDRLVSEPWVHRKMVKQLEEWLYFIYGIYRIPAESGEWAKPAELRDCQRQARRYDGNEWQGLAWRVCNERASCALVGRSRGRAAS